MSPREMAPARDRNDGETAQPNGVAGESLEHVARELQARIAAFLEEKHADTVLKGVQEQVRISMGVIDEALDRYEVPELSMAYNGGKDCLILLVLILACLPRHFAKSATPSAPSSVNPDAHSPTPAAAAAFPKALQAVYVVAADPFPQVDDFVARSARQYHLDVHAYALPMKEALAAYLADQGRLVRAVFVGTRRTDPHGARLTHFDPTDKGWPAFMRVHPVIDWHYAEIWALIRHLEIPYCCLYDQGYTSLGGTTDTLPNPALKMLAGAKGDEFRPAYELKADEEERLGRNR